MARFALVVASGLALFSLTIAVEAQQPDPPNANSELIRAEYANSKNLPDEVAFLETMRFLYVVNRSSSDTAVGFVKQGMGLDEIEAEEFLALMLSTFKSVNSEIQNKKFNVACSGGASKIVGAAVYSAFEAIDDLPEHVAGVRLHKLKAEIGPGKAKRLEHWLEQQKLQIVHVKYNRKELYKRRGESARANLEVICAGLATTQRGGDK